MNKNIIIGGIVAAVVVVGGVAFVATNKKDDTSNSAQSSSQSGAKEEVSSMQESNTNIAELRKKGDPQKCTFSSSEAGSEFSGTGYFTKERFQADFNMKSAAESRTGSVLVSGSTQYFWEPSTKKGVKTAVQADVAQSQTGQGLDANKNYVFKCEKWTVDESKFTPPADVQFQDLTQLMQSVPQVPAR